MPCAHFAGLTERFAREIEAVKTQYPFEDMKIQCGLTTVGQLLLFCKFDFGQGNISGSFDSPVFDMDLL